MVLSKFLRNTGCSHPFSPDEWWCSLTCIDKLSSNYPEIADLIIQPICGLKQEILADSTFLQLLLSSIDKIQCYIRRRLTMHCNLLKQKRFETNLHWGLCFGNSFLELFALHLVQTRVSVHLQKGAAKSQRTAASFAAKCRLVRRWCAVRSRLSLKMMEILLSKV